nr:hypothetical protein [Salinibacter ruber]
MVRLAQRSQVVEVVTAVDQVKTGNGFEQRPDGDSQEAVLFGVAEAR